ncbi:MAG TPA: hypothetical protein VLR27_02775 [Acidimicrobiales bacterium]|nr:hypothetical protein [Acidimicrobiales bacterium]
MTRFLWILAGLGCVALGGIAVVAWHVPTREHVVEAGRTGRGW